MSRTRIPVHIPEWLDLDRLDTIDTDDDTWRKAMSFEQDRQSGCYIGDTTPAQRALIRDELGDRQRARAS